MFEKNQAFLFRYLWKFLFWFTYFAIQWFFSYTFLWCFAREIGIWPAKKLILSCMPDVWPLSSKYHKTLLTTSPHCTRLYFNLISLTRVTTITWFRILTDTSPQLKSIPAGCWACLPCTPRWPAAVYCIKKILWQFRNITVDKKTCAIVCETRKRLFFGEISVQTLPMGNSNAKMRFTIAFALSSK